MNRIQTLLYELKLPTDLAKVVIRYDHILKDKIYMNKSFEMYEEYSDMLLLDDDHLVITDTRNAKHENKLLIVNIKTKEVEAELISPFSISKVFIMNKKIITLLGDRSVKIWGK